MGWCQVEDEILVHQASCAMGIDGLEELAAEYASASAYYEAAKTKVGALFDTLARYAISLSLNYTHVHNLDRNPPAATANVVCPRRPEHRRQLPLCGPAEGVARAAGQDHAFDRA